ncbi:hypothetical protein PLICRDRAFT_79272, partial [Plicaturopsis crispa FD-325 SS-3]
FGHVGDGTLKTMISKGMVEGLDVSGKGGQGQCEDCIFGKQARRPFDEVVEPETEVLEWVHIDLWGPSQVMSKSGKQYMMTISD